jgi:integrase
MEQQKRLTKDQVNKLTEIGRHCDGAGLNLLITRTKKGTLSKRWTFMFSRQGHQREMGLGSTVRVTLAEARAKASKCRALLDQGVDPLGQKEAPCAAPVTFRERALAHIEAKGGGWNATHLGQWRKTIDGYLAPIGTMPVATIDTEAVLRVLKPLWAATPVTAQRVRGRIEAVLDSAKALGLRNGEINPAAWKNHLALILPGHGRGEQEHHAAMPYNTVANFIRDLRARGSIAALALEFLILTAARSGEVIFSAWDEFDLAARVWTVPASRTKTSREHHVPLSDRAIAILQDPLIVGRDGLVFRGYSVGQPLGKTAMWRLCPEGASPHGFRSSFRDWCGNETSFPREVAEAALAHRSGDSTEQAYRRGDALAKRRELMAAWASYVEPAPVAGVTRLRG